jgi:hypothetical protein
MDTRIQELMEKAMAGTATAREKQELLEGARLELEKIKAERPEEYLELERLMYDALLALKKPPEN